MEGFVCAQSLLRDYPQGLLTEAKLGHLATRTHGRVSLGGQEHPGNRQNVVSFQRDTNNYGETVPSLTTATAGSSISYGPSGRVFFPLPRLDTEAGMCSQMVCMKTVCESECHFQLRQTVLDHRNEST